MQHVLPGQWVAQNGRLWRKIPQFGIDEGNAGDPRHHLPDRRILQDACRKGGHKQRHSAMQPMLPDLLNQIPCGIRTSGVSQRDGCLRNTRKCHDANLRRVNATLPSSRAQERQDVEAWTHSGARASATKPSDPQSICVAQFVATGDRGTTAERPRRNEASREFMCCAITLSANGCIV